jgi:nucleotide-binding universal stress UspA family protein
LEIKTILVHLDLNRSNGEILAIAADLATRAGARVNGLAASLPSAIVASAEGAMIAAEAYVIERQRLEGALTDLQSTFENTVPTAVRGRFIQLLDNPADALASAGRTADLLIVLSAAKDDELDLGTLMVSAGRPVLVVAPGTTRVRADRIVVAWKDGREARRAVGDALPLLKAAQDVLVLAVDEGDLGAEKSAIDDVVGWLKTHGVVARGEVMPMGQGLAGTVDAAAIAFGADLVVAGAYGHSRFREWLLGGMTRELMTRSALHRLFSN